MRTQSRDTTPEAERVLIELIRNAPIAKRFELVRSLTSIAAKLNRQNIWRLHPDFSQKEIATNFATDHYDQTLAQGLHLALKQKTTLLSPDLLDTLSSVVKIFEQFRVSYYIRDSLAVSLYGMQRAVFSIDFVIDMHPDHINTMLQSFQTVYYMQEKKSRDDLISEISFEGIHLETALRITISLAKSSSFNQEIQTRMQSHMLTEHKSIVYVASPEDIILTQLKEYRANGEIADDQWSDILGVLKIQGSTLDFAYLQRWGKVLNITEILENAYLDAGIQ